LEEISSDASASVLVGMTIIRFDGVAERGGRVLFRHGWSSDCFRGVLHKLTEDSQWASVCPGERTGGSAPRFWRRVMGVETVAVPRVC